MSNEKAEALLKKYEDAGNKYFERMKKLEATRFDHYKFKREAQKVCTHPTTRKEEFTDYHTRTDWVTTICTVCDKQLSKV